MDWANETYVRLYVRDTLTWKRLGWEGRCVLALLLRKLDRAGVLDLSGADPHEAVEIVTDLPPDVVRPGLDRCLKEEVFVIDGDRVLMPNYVDAQNASSSTAKRQREFRARKIAKRRLTGSVKKLYFIQEGDDGPVKIGTTTGTVDDRLKELQTANSQPLTLLGYNENGDQEEEVHERFEKHRLVGEWFRPDPEVLDFARNESLQLGVTKRNAECPPTLHNTTPHNTHGEQSPPSATRPPSSKAKKRGGVDLQRVRDKRGKARGRKKGRATAPAAASPDPDLFVRRGNKERDDLLRLLETKGDTKLERATQRKLLERIEKEVLRVYRERREAATGSGYVRIQDKGRKAAKDIGVACIGYGITPDQLFEYWANPDNSSWTGMKFPSLTFIASEKNVDRAACSIKPAKGSVRTRGPVAATRREDFDGEGDDFNDLMEGRRGRRKTGRKKGATA